MFSIPATNPSTRAIPRLVALAMLIGALALTLIAIGLISVVAACLVAPMPSRTQAHFSPRRTSLKPGGE